MFRKGFQFLTFTCYICKKMNCTRIDINRFSSALQNNLKKGEKTDARDDVDYERMRHKYQDFLPSPNYKHRHPLREKLERIEMLRRRAVLHIPEFYVGSILAVTTSNKHAPGKTTRFVGICIMKHFCGLFSKFILRNVVDNLGVEVLYELYSPVIQSIEVLKLEKRLDEELFYLRDAPNEYSTFAFDMEPQYVDIDAPVPINTLKVKINPRPWLQRYERMNLKGAIVPPVSEKMQGQAKRQEKMFSWQKYDLVDQYRKTIPEENQIDIFNEICDELKKLETFGRKEKKKIVLEKKIKTRVF